jgi:MFS family permease
MRVTRWSSLSAGLLVELAAGTAYGFGSYSEQLKSILGGDQSAVNLVGSVGQIGLYTALLGGLFYDRFGARMTLLLGGILSAAGYALAYIATLGIGFPATTASLCVCYFVSWHGSGYLDTAAISTSVKNFPANKGAVIGLLKSFFGLSGSVVAQVSVGFFGGQASSTRGVPLLLFLTCLVLGVALLSSLALGLDSVRHSTKRAALQGSEWCRLGAGYALVLTLSAYLAVIGILRERVSFSRAAGVATTLGAALLIVTLLAVLSTTNTWWGTRRSGAADDPLLLGRDDARDDVAVVVSVAPDQAATTNTQTIEAPPADDLKPHLSSRLAAAATATSTSASTAAAAAATPRSLHGECTAPQALCTPTFWLLWLSMFCGTGPGLMVLSNVAQIAQARAGAYTSEAHVACHTSAFYHTLASTLTIVCGVANCGGRCLGGFLSDKFGRTISRPSLFSSFLLLMALSQLLCALIGGVAVLYLALALCFIAYGAYWALMPVLCAELYGEKSLGAIYSLFSLAPASASFAVTVGIASNIYAAHVPPHAPPLCARTVHMEDGKCFGPQCYRLTFLVTTGLCCFGTVLAALLARRMAPYYRAR